MQSRQDGKTVGWPIATGGVMLLILAGWLLGSGCGGGGKNALSIESRYNLACGETIGQHLAEQYSGSRVLVLLGPSVGGQPVDPAEPALVDGLKKGMGKEAGLMDTLAIQPSAHDLRQLEAVVGDDEAVWTDKVNVEELLSVRVLASILKERKGTFDVLVSTVGLPPSLAKSRLQNAPDLPDIVVLKGDLHQMGDLVRNGVIDAMVVYNPDLRTVKDLADVPGSTKAAFAKRFLLVTPENIDEVAAP